MNISDRGLTFIASHEGWEPKIYLDAAGLPTIGYGHLLKAGEEARFKNGITKEEGKALLKEDVKEAEDAVKRLSGVALTQNQFDALVSFVFNVGQGRYRDSTLRKKVNAGDMKGAADEFLRWIRAGGKVLTGLQRRRAAERKMFLGG
jgi:lysozyme